MFSSVSLRGDPGAKRVALSWKANVNAEVEEIISRLNVQAISAKLELCRIVATTLTRRIESPSLTASERRDYSSRWLEVTHDDHDLEFELGLLRWQERETRLVRPRW